jgi:competence ComEA-like helix-hairpin-helix protein
MTNPLKDFFTFSKNERNGIIMLLVIIALLLVVDLYLRSESSNEPFNSEALEKEIIAFEQSLEDSHQKLKYSKKQGKITNKNTLTPSKELFYFDPNHTTDEEWKKLGVNDQQIRTINNYLENGGVFYNKNDLKKIYGLDQDLYDHLKSHIRIENHQPQPESKEKYNYTEITKERVIRKVELNTADSIQLRMINGIGKVYAERICKYRELLGGYKSLEQLKEVYGINDTIYNNVKTSFKIDTGFCKQINLNKAEFKEIIKHPYINKYQTKSILKYREIRGEIKDIEELLEYNILPKKTYIKLKGYISCK